ncbi:MAG: peptidase [Verrucomicrobiales bacterium]|nr:peptidase [Verrucomicrobiales bacterium]
MRILRACLPAIVLWCAVTSGAELELKIEMTSTVPRIWINGANGAVTIEFSTNLNRVPRWSLLTNVQAVSSPFLFTESAGATASRFFRASAEAASINSLPHLVWIEPGTFTVGAPAGELYRNSQEGPLTEVTLTRGFAMSKFETTQQEYLGLMGNNPSGFSDDLQRPANFVTWTEASNYCARLTAREVLAGHLPPGYTYRLPTEAQWEYACRAGTTTATYLGNSLSSTQANFNGTGPYNGAAAGPNLQTTTRVGSFPSNPWGLFDMSGNVSEWTASLYSNELPGGSVIDPVNLGFSGGYIYRGGSWQDYGWQCRSATRYGTGSESRIARLGFRIILTPGQPDSATPPLILRQPQSLTAKSGEAVTFSLTASGAPLFYQWRLNEADIPGATDPAYRIATVQVTDTGFYSVVVKNSAGHVTSLAAALTVDPLPNPDAARLVWINPGAFMMGSPSNEVGRADDEGPQTQVTVTRGFWMSKFETTQQEYLAVMGNNPSAFAGNLQRPVERVTWNNATNYCAKLTLLERAAGRLPVGYEYRLPTEAEWEYACRAGTTTATAYGDSLSSTQANYNGNFPYGGANAGPYLQTTSPAGSYLPNAWGLHDMHGNAREWCLDWYGAYPGGSVSDPRGTNTDPHRAIRGGDWISQGRSARSAARAFALPGEVGNGGYGFRAIVAPGPLNGGFEQATLSGWKATGDFSAMEPINGDVITVKRVPALWQQLSNTIGGDYWRDLTYPVGQKGPQWLSTAYPRKGTNSWDDQAFSEAAVGSLISQSFVIQQKFITFLMGGGQDDAALRVELLIQATAGPATIEIEGQNYQIVNHATGHGQEWMRRMHWDVSGPALKNRTARIRIVDNSPSGHLNVDDFRFQDLAPLDDLLTVGGQSYPATATFQGYEIDADAPVWGFADMHTHPMSYLGFGGKIMHGQPDGGPATPTSMAAGLSDCKLDHGGWGLDNPQGNYWRQLMMMALDDAGPDPHREGWATNPAVQFRNWPVFTTIAHQQMWYEWIKRARDGGLRVMVALCVNNHLLARVSKGDKPIDDLAVGDSQIAELKNFVARHDDFLEIAYDPFQLRDIVRRGKLAIIIGSELDDIGDFISNPNVKTNADVTSKLLVSAEIRRLHSNGVRYIFPVHLVNNKFSGTAIAGLMLNIANKYASGEGFQVQAATANDNIHFWLENIDLRAQAGLENVSPDVADFILGAGAVAGASLIPIVLPWLATTASLITAPVPGSSAAFTGLAPLAVIGAAGLLPPLLTIIGIDQGDVVEAVIPLPGNYPIYPTPAEAPNGVRNALGLTDLGRHAIKEMMNLGMLIDIDHMSQEGFTGPNGALALATNRPGGYPLNSGHNGFRESGVEERPENSRSLTQMEEIRRLGGLIGVGWENSKGGSYTKPATEVVPTPFYSHSIVSNDCAGTAKTFAQGYLVALERLGGAHVAIGTDIDGFVVSPGPRFGPQAAFGLGEAGGVEASEREEQIAAQHNGVLYEPRYGPALTTAAFRGRAMEPKKLIAPADATQGYAYNVDQADFFAALNIFYTLKADVEAGRMLEQTVTVSINTIVNAYSENYSGQYPEADLSGGSRAHIANYALGLLAGIKDWTIGSDATPDKTATTTIGKAVYGRKNSANYQPPTEIVSNQDYFDRYLHHSDVWDDYQKIFGTNAPMKRCQTGFKQWDVNFEGVAHYGLLPDFLQDLRNVGMQPRDLSVLFRSAEDFAQMWTRSLNASFPAQ